MWLLFSLCLRRLGGAIVVNSIFRVDIVVFLAAAAGADDRRLIVVLLRQAVAADVLRTGFGFAATARFLLCAHLVAYGNRRKVLRGEVWLESFLSLVFKGYINVIYTTHGKKTVYVQERFCRGRRREERKLFKEITRSLFVSDCSANKIFLHDRQGSGREKQDGNFHRNDGRNRA